MTKLENKAAIITGASRGLGKTIAIQLAVQRISGLSAFNPIGAVDDIVPALLFLRARMHSRLQDNA